MGKALNLPDYPKIVKRPMDLGTIDSNLRRGLYNSIDEFWTDLQQVWKNAMIFNIKGDPVYMAAEDLSNEADKKIGRVLQQKASNLAMSSAYPADCAPMST